MSKKMKRQGFLNVAGPQVYTVCCYRDSDGDCGAKVTSDIGFSHARRQCPKTVANKTRR